MNAKWNFSRETPHFTLKVQTKVEPDKRNPEKLLPSKTIHLL
jgi:hypothetical protein